MIFFMRGDIKRSKKYARKHEVSVSNYVEVPKSRFMSVYFDPENE